MSLVESKEQGLSSNKFINNIRKSKETHEGSKSNSNPNYSPSSFAGGHRSPFSQEKQSKRSGFGKNLFASHFSNEKDTQEPNKRLFLIPETTKNSEMEQDFADNTSTSISSVPSNRNSCDDKIQKMIEETNSERQDPEFRIKSRGRLDFEDSPVNKEGEERCHTPTKSKKLFVTQEEKNLFSPKQDYQSLNSNSRIFGIGFHSNAMFGGMRDADENLARKENIPLSRFEADFEKGTILGSGYFGTVYKCVRRIDGLEYAVKTIRYKKKGKANGVDNLK